ncbi:hypothetical protein DENIS_3445 [Desulfonema ishimotonii]|uniref:histidine kinase n=1 Tax=Desulfonema ishimotonii TaxID=45657 RepID=A0A401FZW1_9BACT|nr:response regulator [Desulfonema ishimotonii]GBC62473.1 hypothetical protein DENIS_3445 [Desulfonema ishimotonii]
MKRFTSSIPLNINQKFLVVNLMIFIVFGWIIWIITVSHRDVERLTALIIAEKFEYVIKNAYSGKKFSEVMNRATLLGATFYGNDEFLEREGNRLSRDIRALLEQSRHSQPGVALQHLQKTLAALIDECRKINAAADRIGTVSSRILKGLQTTEMRGYEHISAPGVSDGEISEFTRLNTLVHTCRDSLLANNTRFIRFNPAHSPIGTLDTVIRTLDTSYSELNALSVSDPETGDSQQQLLAEFRDARAEYRKFREAVVAFRAQALALKGARQKTLEALSRIEHQVLSAAIRVRSDSMDAMTASLRYIYILSVAAIVFFAGFTYLLLLLTIRRPMKRVLSGIEAIRSGNLDTRIRLHTRDEWKNIEDAMNGMVADLKASYSELNEKNRELETARNDLEAYMNDLKAEIAERKHVEVALLESNEKFKSLSENAPDIIYTLNSDGAITYVNPACERVLGYSRQEMIERNFGNFARPEDAETYVSFFRRISIGKTTLKLRDAVLLHKDRSRRIFDMSGAPNYNAMTQVSGVVGILKDITEQRKLEDHLQQARKMESIGTLAGGVAHDFNNLLMGIQGHVSLMTMNTEPAHPGFGHLKGIEAQIQRAADLTQQLLGFARKGKQKRTAVNLNDIVKKQNVIFRRTRKEIVIHELYEPKLRPVRVNPGQLEQVLMNLYINAWQAMSGSGSLSVQTRNVCLDTDFTKRFQGDTGDYVCVSVTDTGTGMDEATQKRIFEPFFTTKSLGEGSGLGLSAAYGTIKNYGGFIEVISEKGTGTTFNIFLPALPRTRPENGQQDQRSGNRDKTILLVDDEEMIIEVASDLLTALGYKPLIARSGEEALAVYEAHQKQIDMVLLDMVMPGMDGEETYTRLKAINPGVRVLLSSGYDIDNQAACVLEQGCDSFIQKPFNMAALSQKLRDVLDEK